MAYDEELADRIRLLAAADGAAPAEKRMFGGLAFLVGGNMAIAASGQGGILVRVDPEESEELVRTTAATVAVMRGRPMPGWLRVADHDLAEDEQLAPWVRRGLAYAGALPPKQATEPESST
jgi:TfoX/Sxy family transcriptional regulator of competence genes